MHTPSKQFTPTRPRGVQNFKPYSRVAIASQAKPQHKQVNQAKKPDQGKAGPSGSVVAHNARKKPRGTGGFPGFQAASRGKLGAVQARAHYDVRDDLVLAPDPSPPPDISWPVQFGTLVSFPASE
eukprot:23828-Pelagomonas_calceolata.AAC.1